MKRERATRLLDDMITRLEQHGWPLGLVEEVYVFGSYARGALEPNDIDVVVQHGTDKRWLGESLHASINGRDAYVGMRQALRGRTRGISFQFRERDSLLAEGFELFLLWRRGEPFSLARERLASLKKDPSAGTAPRDHMLAEFEGIERLVPRPARIELFNRHAAGKISIVPLRLLDGEPTDPEAAQHVRRRWVETSPLRRAASCALHVLEQQGVDLNDVVLHGQRLFGRGQAERCFVDLGWSGFGYMGRLLDDGLSWLEVMRPHSSKPMDALFIQPLSRQ
ncbi:nucleotidyltransferase domain-containing protein [Actinacidiphila oryziradicis]|uniref:Nucleotidyltransferase domain-containing protein n=1 Tax=Actinacidiphila oryziradicis TaxID=2571141 RepID=A0A4V5MX93_9ACTN|nr:nucleotidyltransferase domain-containing protein [Actinacidiphila oryziradicis]TJZ99428.1 nucleotidyltransferase domain-containing protein [Actinacidiphila oryziradicis]